MHGTHKSR
jgi:hypothetical protein